MASNILNNALSRIDAVLDAQSLRLEAAEKQAALEADFARAQRARDASEARREIQATYSDAFRSFGSECPMPSDDEAPSAYRRRLYNRLARKLPPNHRLASLRADDLGNQPIVFDNFEADLIRAATLEGESPSEANLPPDGEIVMRTRNDANTNGKYNEFHGRVSFIRDMNRPGRRVVAIRNPRDNTILWGRPLQQA